ncbi:putative phytochrome sensor protein [Pirellula staleyi DSM 6068]|uniref:Putative phytochrome sensor protein n=1 Tax=Pirellula staleyi (strain ATCC 27377 / DSM 6068 / ICPB 4128) TaxID=530564 RepID=D2R6G6_PIRSD|nr:biotin/lipoyl-binding protein [Pirellula staleyi]ADB15544.1 putative phytochrome sensor protein [Pirellula staleyi DSM 6068]
MATGQSQVSSETIEKTKQQIRGLVGEVAQICKSDMTPEEFHAAFLQRVVQALAAVGGAIWVLGEAKKPELSYQINLTPNLLDSGCDDAQKHYRLLDYIIASNQPQLVPPLSGAGDERMGGNPTRQLLVIHPLGHDDQVEALIEIFQRPNSPPATQRGYLQFLRQMCEMASEWFKNRRLKQFSDRHSLWAQADSFSRAAHESLDVRETCYTIVNEGRRLLGCDRVSIALKHGSSCTIEAVSGQDTLDNRSNVVTLLGKLATRVVATGEPLWYYGSTEDMPPQIETAVEEYVDQSYTKSLAVIPIRKPKSADAAAGTTTPSESEKKGELIGAIIVEQIESEIPREVLLPRLDLVYEHSSRALTNAIDHNSLFLMPVWKTLGKAGWVVQARQLPKTLTITGIVLAVLLALAVIQTDFDMRAKGTLQPISKADIFVPQRGVVTEVLVDNGTLVEEGQVLLKMRSDELPLQIAEVEGQLLAAREELAAVRDRVTNTGRQVTEQERARDQAQMSRVQVQVESLDERLQLLLDRKKQLTVVSPKRGRVITWDTKKSLQNRPVEVGQLLMTIAEEGTDYELELYMPEKRIDHIVRYRNQIKKDDPSQELAVDYILMTDPGTYHYGKVTQIDPVAETHEEHGQIVRIKVSTDTELNTPYPGATVTANVNCGKASLGWAKLHEAWEWAEANLFF